MKIGGREPHAQPHFRVEVEPFYLSKFPVTNEQFEAFDPGFERSGLSLEDSAPAVGVSWKMAEEYCRWYAKVSRKPMRLPTEVEWEYACRAGSAESTFFSDDLENADQYLWDASNSGGRLRGAEEKKANGFGLFGMLGGVWEWTASPHRPYPLEATISAVDEEEPRVLRGGSFRSLREDVSCSVRRSAHPADLVTDAGFRIAKSLR